MLKSLLSVGRRDAGMVDGGSKKFERRALSLDGLGAGAFGDRGVFDGGG